MILQESFCGARRPLQMSAARHLRIGLFRLGAHGNSSSASQTTSRYGVTAAQVVHTPPRRQIVTRAATAGHPKLKGRCLRRVRRRMQKLL